MAAALVHTKVRSAMCRGIHGQSPLAADHATAECSDGKRSRHLIARSDLGNYLQADARVETSISARNQLPEY